MAANLSFLILVVITVWPFMLLVQSHPGKNNLQYLRTRQGVESNSATEAVDGENLEKTLNSPGNCGVNDQTKRNMLGKDEESSNPVEEGLDQDRKTRDVKRGRLWATKWPHNIQRTDTEIHSGSDSLEEFEMEKAVRNEDLNTADDRTHSEESKIVRSEAGEEMDFIQFGRTSENNEKDEAISQEILLAEDHFNVTKDSDGVKESSSKTTKNIVILEEIQREAKATRERVGTGKNKGDADVNLVQAGFSASEEAVEISSKLEATISAVPTGVVGRPKGSDGGDESMMFLNLKRNKRQQMGFLHLGSPKFHVIKGHKSHLKKLFDTDPDNTTQS